MPPFHQTTKEPSQRTALLHPFHHTDPITPRKPLVLPDTPFCTALDIDAEVMEAERTPRVPLEDHGRPLTSEAVHAISEQT